MANMISSKLIALASVFVILLQVTICLTAVPGGANTYLPPEKGYNYEKPTVTFPRPAPGPRPTPPVRPGPPAPRPPPGPRPQPTPGPDHPDHVHVPGMPFDFNYSVNDIDSGNDYSHKAESDGDVQRGEYRVQLPDGRTQIVRYTADWKTGYHAEVTYEGEAKYPEGPYPAASGGGGGGVRQPAPSQGYKY